MRSRKPLTLLLIAVALAAISASCGDDEESAAALESDDRTIYMAAIEPKGTGKVAEEPFPSDALPAGGGYKLEEPGETGEWVVETYRWLPGSVTVVEGDHVTLEILGVNGKSHASTIEGYGVDFEVKRGELTTVEFDADKPGVFRIVCNTHQPAMTAELIVLPA